MYLRPRNRAMSNPLHLDMVCLRQIGNQRGQSSGFDDDILIAGQDQNRGCDVGEIVGRINMLDCRAAPFYGFDADFSGDGHQKFMQIERQPARQHTFDPERAVIMIIQT